MAAERWTLEGSPYGFRTPQMTAGRTLEVGEVVEVMATGAETITRRECEACGVPPGGSHAYACKPGTRVYRAVEYVRKGLRS